MFVLDCVFVFACVLCVLFVVVGCVFVVVCYLLVGGCCLLCVV